MTSRHRRPRLPSGERGATLLEAMIALTILLIGLVGMAHLQIFGMNSTQGARAHTIATQLAAELAGGLGRIQASDPQLSGAVGTGPTTPPAVFGRLIPLGTPTTGVHVYNDATPIPGTHLDADLERNPEDLTQPIYRRRWTVWDVGVASTGTAAKLVAVSVIWRERGSAAPREVVLYVNSEIRGSFMANINAFK